MSWTIHVHTEITWNKQFQAGETVFPSASLYPSPTLYPSSDLPTVTTWIEKVE